MTSDLQDTHVSDERVLKGAIEVKEIVHYCRYRYVYNFARRVLHAGTRIFEASLCTQSIGVLSMAANKPHGKWLYIHGLYYIGRIHLAYGTQSINLMQNGCIYMDYI